MLERKITGSDHSEPSITKEDKKEDYYQEQNIVLQEKPKEETNKELPKETSKIKIDCQEIDECMNITMPIQFSYQELIADIFYLEIIENNVKLGYQIDYTFRPHTYENEEICTTKLSEIATLLKDHIEDISCNNSTLTISPNKERSILDENS